MYLQFRVPHPRRIPPRALLLLPDVRLPGRAGKRTAHRVYLGLPSDACIPSNHICNSRWATSPTLRSNPSRAASTLSTTFPAGPLTRAVTRCTSQRGVTRVRLCLYVYVRMAVRHWVPHTKPPLSPTSDHHSPQATPTRFLRTLCGSTATTTTTSLSRVHSTARVTSSSSPCGKSSYIWQQPHLCKVVLYPFSIITHAPSHPSRLYGRDPTADFCIPYGTSASLWGFVPPPTVERKAGACHC